MPSHNVEWQEGAAVGLGGNGLLSRVTLGDNLQRNPIPWCSIAWQGTAGEMLPRSLGPASVSAPPFDPRLHPALVSPWHSSGPPILHGFFSYIRTINSNLQGKQMG